MGGLLDSHQGADGVDETVDGARGLAGPGAEAPHREEGTVHQARPVDEVEDGTRAHRRDCSFCGPRIPLKKRREPAGAPLLKASTDRPGYCRRSILATSCLIRSLVQASWASPRPLWRHSSELVPIPLPPLEKSNPPPLLDSPTPLPESMISPVVMSMTRPVIRTSLLVFFPPSPIPFTRTPPPRASVENLVIEPTRMYLTPSTLPILAMVWAEGSARPEAAKSCSPRMAFSFLRSMTRKEPSSTRASTSWSAIP